MEPPRDPSITFESLTFSDGQTVALGETDIVVLVGPNNSGKSEALRELEANVAAPSRRTVLHGAKLRKWGDSKTFQKYLEDNAKLVRVYGRYHYVGYKYEIDKEEIQRFDSDNVGKISRFFVLRSATDTRLSDSDPAKAIAYLKEKPEHPIHIVVLDPQLEAEISGYFKRAFGKDLMVFRAGGSEVPLLVGNKDDLPADAREFDPAFIEVVKDRTVELYRQGDGMRAFATVVLNMIAVRTQSVLLLDEPESFLHPPQARLLSELLANSRKRKSQIFIATHSPDILQGLIGSNEPVRVLRLTRDGRANRVHELNSKTSLDLARDPFTRFSGIFSAIFHQHVFICESDADCLFYNAILDASAAANEVRPDVLFVHGGGKHRLHKLASTAFKLGVPHSVIVDIDILNDEGTFRRIFESVGGQWNQVSKDWKALKTAVDQQRPAVTWDQAVSSVQSLVEKVRERSITLGQFVDAVKDVFRTNSPWEMVKRAGRSALPPGDATDRFDRVCERAAAVGLWIVPVGELEGFCRSSTSMKGAAWVESLLTTRELQTDPELAEARSFIGEVWRSTQLSSQIEAGDPPTSCGHQN